jgi:PAS domain S-box-containing protein
MHPNEAPDLSELRKQLATSQAREQQLRRMLDAVPDQAIFALDAQGRIATWHPGMQQINGYSAQDVLGQHFSMFFTEADASAGQPAQELAAALAMGMLVTEGWRRCKDGSRFWASVALVAMRDEAGALTGYTKVMRDLTERKHQEDLLARIAGLSPIAMLLIGADGRIRYLNGQAETMFGYSRGSLEGEHLHRLIPERFHGVHGQHMQFFMQQVTNRPMGLGRDLQARRQDGSEIEVEVGLSGIDTSEGQAVLAAVVDVSDRRRQQRALEAGVSEKDTLLKEVYHRVKNNLQVVQSLLSMQRRAVPEGPARAAFDDSALRVRAMAMVHELLYRAGNLAAVPLRAYTIDLLHQIGLSAGAQRRAIRVEADVVEADTGLDAAVPYGLLLVELVSNSLKHAFDGRAQGCVEVRLTRRPEGLHLQVTDDGAGLPEGFSLSHPRTLGLQLAVSLARQLGGDLVHANRALAGAEFTAPLPRL